jgi:ELWxxDGT repeat protein
LFSSYDVTHRREFWVTDGTIAGTSLVKDIYSGVVDSFPYDITALGNGTAVFSANDGPHGRELWVSDGTAAGTKLVLDINPGLAGLAGSSPKYLSALGNGKVLFSADDGSNGEELWVTDGTGANTKLVKDIYSGSASSAPHEITALGNGKTVFSANDGIFGAGLWVTDGTAAGTVHLLDVNSVNAPTNPGDITALGNGKALFRTDDDGVYGNELWITDGTTLGTRTRGIEPWPSHLRRPMSYSSYASAESDSNCECVALSKDL